MPVDKLGPAGPLMSDAVQACVHCGFCLPTCPTYGPLGQEMDTPRGRIVLMKETLEGTLPFKDAMPYVDRCLGCLACETSCPSGVSYRDLIGPFREKASRETKASFGMRMLRCLSLGVLTRPLLFRKLAKVAFLVKPLRKLFPRRFRLMLDLLPTKIPKAKVLPETTYPKGMPRARVALVAGCAQGVLEPEINASTVSVLVRHGVEVVVPRGQGCCGALHWHSGGGERARHLARENIAVFGEEYDAIISNAAGCGSCLKEYPLVLMGEAEEEKARPFSEKVCDLAVFLDNIGLEPPPPVDKPLRMAYQDACHLRHGQNVSGAPRRILGAIPGVELIELAEPDICCGSAGLYNIEHPDIASELGQKKAGHILAVAPDIVVSANIGCLTQLRHHLQNSSTKPPVLHLAVALHLAYSGNLGKQTHAHA